MLKRNLTTVLAEMAEASKVLSIDIINVKQKNRASISIAKTDAEVKMKGLREEYGAQLAERVATIFVVGSKTDCETFSQIAQAETSSIIVSADAMYERIATEIEPTVGAQRMFGGTQLQHLIRSLEDVGREAGAQFLKVPRLLDVVVCKSERNKDGPTVGEVVKDIVVSQVGVELNAKWLQAGITSEAIAEEYDGRVVSVIVLCQTIEDAKAIKPLLFSGFGIGVTLDEGKVDLATVQKAFEQLKEKLAKKS